MRVLAAVLVLLLPACRRIAPREQAIATVESYVEAQAEILRRATGRLREQAPDPAADGWQEEHIPALRLMRGSWREARDAHARIEGAIETLIPDIERSVDGRYEEMVPDADLFDGEGVTGMHAVERILWAGEHPPATVRFESRLRGYLVASVPTDQAEASLFRDGLLARLEDDCRTIRDRLGTVDLDPATAFRAVTASIEEQRKKVDLASTGEDESRYSRRTLAEMRANLEGGERIFDAMVPWLRARGGRAEELRVRAGFERLRSAYEAVEGDAMPPHSADWNPDAPDGSTPYGRLHRAVSEEGDPDRPDGLLRALLDAAAVLEIAAFPSAR